MKHAKRLSKRINKKPTDDTDSEEEDLVSITRLVIHYIFFVYKIRSQNIRLKFGIFNFYAISCCCIKLDVHNNDMNGDEMSFLPTNIYNLEQS